jgi:hypothetical protein
VRWVAGQADRGDLGARLQGRQATFRGLITGEHRRTPDATASLALGIDKFIEFAAAVGAIDEAGRKASWERAWRVLCEGATAQRAEQQEEDPVLMFVEAIPAVLVAGRAHVAGRDGEVPQGAGDEYGWRRRTSTLREEGGGYTEVSSTHQPLGNLIGWIEGGALWLLPDEAVGAVNKMLREQGRGIPVTVGTLAKRLRETGWTVDFTEGSNRKSVKVGGSAYRVFAMDAARVLGGAGYARLV